MLNYSWLLQELTFVFTRIPYILSQGQVKAALLSRSFSLLSLFLAPFLSQYSSWDLLSCLNFHTNYLLDFWQCKCLNLWLPLCPESGLLSWFSLFLGPGLWLVASCFHSSCQMLTSAFTWALRPSRSFPRTTWLLCWLFSVTIVCHPSLLHPLTYNPQKWQSRTPSPTTYQQPRTEVYILKQCQHDSVSCWEADTGCGLLA